MEETYSERHDREIKDLRKQVATLAINNAIDKEAIRGEMKLLNFKVTGIVLVGTVVGNFAATWLIRFTT